MTPEGRLREGEVLISKVEGSKPLSWARLTAIRHWSVWIRRHGLDVLRFARKTQRISVEVATERDAWKRAAVNINKALEDKFPDAVEGAE